MDYWSALDHLGLEDDDELTREQVRRTYMRKLRDHPPERDPEGFQLLREAYEMLRHQVPEGTRPEKEEPARVVVVEAPSEVELPGINVGAILAVPPIGAILAVPPIDSVYSVKPPIEELAAKVAERMEAPPVEPPPVEELPVREPEEPSPPAMSLDQLVVKLLVLMQHDEVDEAIALEAEWGRHGDTDDHRRASEFVALRWALTRDLLGVAPRLPVIIVRALAEGIEEHDISLAVPAIEEFRKTAPKAASEASTILVTRAPDLYKHVRDALYVPPPPAKPAPAPRPAPAPYVPVTPRARGGSVWAIVAGLLLMARIAASGDCGTRSKYHDVKIDPEMLRYHVPPPPQIDYAKLADLDHVAMTPPPNPLATRTTLLSEATFELTNLTMGKMLTAKQQHIADQLQNYVYVENCPRIRSQLLALERSKPAPESESHLQTIRERVDLACPAPAKPKKKP